MPVQVATLLVVSRATAMALVGTTLDRADQLGIRVSVSVVDPALHLVAFGRSDGASPHGIESSRRKANTAAAKGLATGWMVGDLALSLPLAAGNALTNVRGGLPLVVDGTRVAGMGVAGGTEEEDEALALWALSKVSGPGTEEP